MDEFNPGDGWREVDLNAAAERLLMLHEAGKPSRVWAEEKPVPPLPTEPYTVIRAQVDSRKTTLILLAGIWHRPGDGQPIRSTSITGFEVLAAPGPDWADWAKREDEVRRETEKAVLDRVSHFYSISEAVTVLTREFGVES